MMGEDGSRGRGELLSAYLPWQSVKSSDARSDGLICAGDISSKWFV